MSDLIQRLRTERSVYDAELCDEAADRIEELEAENAKLLDRERELNEAGRILKIENAELREARENSYCELCGCAKCLEREARTAMEGE